MPRRAGDVASYLIDWQQSDGTARTGKVLGNLTRTWHKPSGSFTPTDALTEISGGRYRYDVTMPAEHVAISGILLPDTATDVIVGNLIDEQVVESDTDSLADMLTVGTVSTGGQLLADDIDLGDVVEGDAYRSPTFTVDPALLARWGYANLASFATGDLRSALKFQPTDTPVTVTSELVSGAGSQVRFLWATWPAALNLPAGEREKTVFADIQLIDTPNSRIVTIARAQLRIVWQREARTS